MYSWALIAALWSFAALQADGRQNTLEDKHPHACPDYKKYSAYPQYTSSLQR